MPFLVAAGTRRQPQADHPTSPGAGGELESGPLDREQTFGLEAIAGLLPNLPQPGPPSPGGCWKVCVGKLVNAGEDTGEREAGASTARRARSGKFAEM